MATRIDELEDDDRSLVMVARGTLLACDVLDAALAGDAATKEAIFEAETESPERARFLFAGFDSLTQSLLVSLLNAAPGLTPERVLGEIREGALTIAQGTIEIADLVGDPTKETNQ